MSPQLTLLEAYRAMFVYLDWYYDHMGRPDVLGQLLSELRLLQDGSSADPAAWTDWLAAVEKVTGDQGGEA